MMRRATVRQDRSNSTWTARRPAYGFSPIVEERTGFRTQRAALRWVNSTIRTFGTVTMLGELAEPHWLVEDC